MLPAMFLSVLLCLQSSLSSDVKYTPPQRAAPSVITVAPAAPSLPSAAPSVPAAVQPPWRARLPAANSSPVASTPAPAWQQAASGNTAEQDRQFRDHWQQQQQQQPAQSFAPQPAPVVTPAPLPAQPLPLPVQQPLQQPLYDASGYDSQGFDR